jgi:Predicted multitransmembrane protein
VQPAKRNEALFVAVILALSVVLCLVPTGYHSPYAPGTSVPAIARITAVDNSVIKIIGPVKEGEQQLELRIVTGRFAGREFHSSNNLVGKMEIDKMFAPGDRVLVVVDLKDGGREAGYVNVIDHFRVDILALLALAFLGFLVALGGWTGVKSVLSFVFTALVIFKFLMPSMLWGWNPIWTTLGVVAIIEASAIFLIGGLTRRAFAAFAGAMGGVLVTALLGDVVTRALKIHGAVRPYAETLLYSGFGHLDLTALFVAGVFLASSGAVMDLSMDIAAAMDEVREKDPGISRRELLRSGMTVGKQVLGTMTTTLLLAYSSSYSALIMTFIAQGLPLINAVNLVLVSAELAHTLVGSLGLILVAPLTAVAGSFVLTRGADAAPRSGTPETSGTGVSESAAAREAPASAPASRR